MVGRKSDSKRRLWFRSSRVFASNDKWYFHTREGIDMGPYDSQFEAEIEAEILKELLQESAQREGAVGVIREFVLDSFQMGRPLSPDVNGADNDRRKD